MSNQHYQLKLDGLKEPQGQIKASDLHQVLGALIKTAERATRLMATGESKGGKPKWLAETTAFVVTGLTEGSTILEIDAPEIGATAKEHFVQSDFWREPPENSDTALTLAAQAIDEALSDGDSSERFDSGLLDAALEFRKVARDADIKYKLIPTGNARGTFELSQRSYETFEAKKKKLPEPRAFIVSGRLDHIQYSDRQFLLVLTAGQKLRGSIHQEFLSEESLRPLWGKPVTIEGLVHFKANGTPRFIEARKLSVQTSQDSIFDEMPRISVGETAEFFPELSTKSKKRADPMVLWNTWPGDESIDELMAQLD
ncbi:hypothetical protein [Pelagicoccus sp. SDUM812002]|uniref:hypothetical protein n=1 Tax=Pelagicoccus sp. SDUM812002 TaxID=3041266 RepID=UPI00280F2BE0|nr:hypothetical protein [Pelagicoccus sp. SDUM812002]MDQ8184085.1 hypothetical protein [Pelagicoccus sp. SDUM812002]